MYPHYPANSTRMQSYATWPAISKQKPESLSNAGFFCTGKELHTKACLLQKNISSKPSNVQIFFFVTSRHDHTACFHGGVALRDWQEADCAWKERARWSPKYLYVIHIKGIAFVLVNAEALKTTQAF
jgi:hypothetical protein